MTNDEKELEIQRVVSEVTNALQKAVPEDMNLSKCLDRVQIIREFIGLSRTTAIACAIYAASYMRITGLDVNLAKDMIDAVDEVMKNSPLLEEAQATYAADNAKYHAKQGGDSDFEQLLLSPDSGKVH